mgnify:CR=1 FL=1
MSDITVHQLHQLMQSGPVELIDVRTGMEFRGGHAVGARHVPLGSLDPAKLMAERTAAKYREAFRLTRHEMPVGLDLVLIPRKPDEPTLEALKEALPRLVKQAARKLAQGPPR